MAIELIYKPYDFTINDIGHTRLTNYLTEKISYNKGLYPRIYWKIRHQDIDFFNSLFAHLDYNYRPKGRIIELISTLRHKRYQNPLHYAIVKKQDFFIRLSINFFLSCANGAQIKRLIMPAAYRNSLIYKSTSHLNSEQFELILDAVRFLSDNLFNEVALEPLDDTGLLLHFLHTKNENMVALFQLITDRSPFLLKNLLCKVIINHRKRIKKTLRRKNDFAKDFKSIKNNIGTFIEETETKLKYITGALE